MRWVLLVALAVLPVQWMQVPLPPLGQQRVSVAVVLVATGLAVLTCSRHAVATVLRTTWPFVVPMGALIVLWGASSAFYGDPLAIPLTQAVQLGVFVMIGTLTLAVLGTDRGVALLRWTGPLALVVLLVTLQVSLSVNGVAPVDVVTRSVAAGSPEIVQTEIFKLGLVGFGFDADSLLSNVRHEIFAGLLVATLVTRAAVRTKPFERLLPRVLTTLSLVVTVLLVLGSLSRSVTIALLLWPALAAWRTLQRREVRPVHLLGGAGLLVLLAAASATGVGAVVVSRFTQDTTSYDKRDELLVESFQSLAGRPLFGGTDTRGQSSHNLLLDSWLRSGLLGLALALVVAAVLILLWTSILAQLGREPAWMVPAAALLGLALVRLFTAGGGTPPPVEWVALALVAGLLAHRRRLGDRREPGAGPADASTAAPVAPMAAR